MPKAQMPNDPESFHACVVYHCLLLDSLYKIIPGAFVVGVALLLCCLYLLDCDVILAGIRVASSSSNHG